MGSWRMDLPSHWFVLRRSQTQRHWQKLTSFAAGCQPFRNIARSFFGVSACIVTNGATVKYVFGFASHYVTER